MTRPGEWLAGGFGVRGVRLRDGVRLGKTLLAIGGIAVLASAGSVAQNDGAGAGNPIAGTWHQAFPAQVGGTIHNFTRYGADGSFLATSVNEGGSQNGMRMELWGHYTIKAAGNGQYLVTTYYEGKAPEQICMQGMGCRSNGPLPSRPDRGLYQFQGDMLQSNTGITAERSGIPPALLQRLPATWMLQPPPPLTLPSGGGTSGGGGRYVSPRNNTPGLGGNCDDLQQSRICTYGNGGYYHKDAKTGCMVCEQH